ncbi:MAG: PleD family two-component system response regulator [Promethearchaeota archaeon]
MKKSKPSTNFERMTITIPSNVKTQIRTFIDEINYKNFNFFFRSILSNFLDLYTHFSRYSKAMDFNAIFLFVIKSINGWKKGKFFSNKEEHDKLIAAINDSLNQVNNLFTYLNDIKEENLGQTKTIVEKQLEFIESEFLKQKKFLANILKELIVEKVEFKNYFTILPDETSTERITFLIPSNHKEQVKILSSKEYSNSSFLIQIANLYANFYRTLNQNFKELYTIAINSFTHLTKEAIHPIRKNFESILEPINTILGTIILIRKIIYKSLDKFPIDIILENINNIKEKILFIKSTIKSLFIFYLKKEDYMVMILDDDKFSRELIAENLLLRNISSKMFSSTNSAFIELEKYQPRMILIDVELGDHLDGREFCREIKKIPELTEIPKFIVTNFHFDKALLLEETGADGAFSKPLTSKDYDFFINLLNPEP